MATYQPYFAGYDRFGNPVDQNGIPYPSAPYQSSAQRLYPMERQTMPASPQPQPPAPGVMAVTSEAEARAYQPDLSGATQFFVQKDGGRIYTKQFNTQTALIDFEVYEKTAGNQPAAQTAQEPSALLGVAQGFNDKLDALQSEIKMLREAVTNGNKSDGDSKPAGKSKSANATDNAAGAGDGKGGQ